MMVKGSEDFNLLQIESQDPELFTDLDSPYDANEMQDKRISKAKV